MARWACGACGSPWAPGAPCCPECRSLEHVEEDAVKITSSGVSRGPGDFEPREHPGTGEPMEGVEAPADGSPVTITQDGDGEPGEQVVQLPPGEFAEPGGPALYQAGEGGIAGPEGLELLKAPAEGAQAEAPAVDVSIKVAGADEALAAIGEAKAKLDELAATTAGPADAPAQDAAPAPEPAAPPVPPRTPPRRVPPGGGDGA